jgi:hypothetical protein
VDKPYRLDHDTVGVATSVPRSRFFVRLGPFLRPGPPVIAASRAGRVEGGRRLGRERRIVVSRPSLDADEHGVNLDAAGDAMSSPFALNVASR